MWWVFVYDFVTNFLLSLTVKEFWKSDNIWCSYGQELGVLFFLTHSVVHVRQHVRLKDSDEKRKWNGTWSVVVWTASLNEQTPWTASSAGRYSDASSSHCKHCTLHCWCCWWCYHYYIVTTPTITITTNGNHMYGITEYTRTLVDDFKLERCHVLPVSKAEQMTARLLEKHNTTSLTAYDYMNCS